MKNITKEERVYVRKNVYMFTVTDKIGGSFSITFNDVVSAVIPMTHELDSFFRSINKPEISFNEQYYICKNESKLHGFTFDELDEKKWRNKK